MTGIVGDVSGFENRWFYSKIIYKEADIILSCKLSSTETDTLTDVAGIRYYVSADGGENWQEIIAGTQTNLSSAGAVVLLMAEFWRNDSSYNPSVSYLNLQLYKTAV